MLHQHAHAVTGTPGIGRPASNAVAIDRARLRRSSQALGLEELLPCMRAVGITTAVAKISGNGNETRVDGVKIYPCPDIRIKVPTDRGRTQVRAADAIKAVVEETVADIRFLNGHSGRYWIEASTGNTRLEMHADRG